LNGRYGKRNARLEITQVELPQTLRKSILARRHVLRAGQRHRRPIRTRHRCHIQIARIERLLEGQVRAHNILLLQIPRQIVRHHNRIIVLVEVRQVAAVL